jgi:NitT/TauT family transport system permease protein
MSMSTTFFNDEKQETAQQALPVGVSRPLSRSRQRAPYRTSTRLLTIVPPLLLGIVLLLSWYTSTATGSVPAYQLPGPIDVWDALWDGLTSGLFLSNALVTVQESLGGFLLAILIALPVGYSLVKWRLFAATVQPYLAAGQAIPAIVLAPFLVLWLGYGIEPVVVLCTLVVLFPMVITTSLGFQTIDASLTEAARVEGASFWPMLTRIELPLALPAIMAAIRTGLTLSIVGALVGEFVAASDQGLGALVQVAKSQYNMSLMFATVVILAVLAALFYGISQGLTRLTEKIYS